MFKCTGNLIKTICFDFSNRLGNRQCLYKPYPKRLTYSLTLNPGVESISRRSEEYGDCAFCNSSITSLEVLKASVASGLGGGDWVVTLIIFLWMFTACWNCGFWKILVRKDNSSLSSAAFSLPRNCFKHEKMSCVPTKNGSYNDIAIWRMFGK